jgi:ABC-type proline/glycine betaine transport system substrate-binding protein
MMNRFTQRLTWVTGFSLLLFSLIACQSNNNSSSSESASRTKLPGEGVKVRPGAGYAAESRFIPEIVNIGLEQLGYDVENIKQLTPSAVYVALGNNDLDILALHWQYLFAGFLKKNGQGANLQVVGDITNNLLQGYQIDQKTANQYKITNISQLKDPKLAQLFDTDGDGKANLFGCYPGMACELIIDHHLKTYGLENTVEHDKGEPSILISEILSRYKQGKPVLYFTYTPHWLTLELKPGVDVVWLTVPFTSLPKEMGEFTEKQTSVNGKNLGFAVDRIQVVGNREFLDKNPVAKHFFELVQVPILDVGYQQKLMKEGEDRPKDIRRHAEQWVEKNQNQFNQWITEAKQAEKTTNRE